jgi:threonine dehydrogenase-like Zn-dependent dehydrogenase
MAAAASPRIFDVVVAGAGPAGLAFAAAVKHVNGGENPG